MADRKTLSLEQVGALREKTEAISQYLHRQLTAHLETLRPLLAPRRVLGKHVRSSVKEDVVGDDRALAQLKERYQAVAGKPFGLPPELDHDALDQLENRLDLYPWQYAHEAKAGKEAKAVTITSPVRWVMSYGSGYTLAEVRQALAGQMDRRPDYLRHFVVNALAMDMFLGKFAGIRTLLADLRYEVKTGRAPGLGDLPLATIQSCVPSFRPADELIVSATRFSGVPAFIELIDPDAVRGLADPLRAHIEAMLQ